LVISRRIFVYYVRLFPPYVLYVDVLYLKDPLDGLKDELLGTTNKQEVRNTP